ncbi:hypothetical protein U9M48_038425 [Paspalum notatum var. saurae]|uniref:F-box domain-containing protein n=1 Tax=Paspalum notatum var. saurae TaxID=547442 RepID=A0AAQ3XDJ2_PASNO
MEPPHGRIRGDPAAAPAIIRWRLRLVCRHWRDVIRERTPATDNPPVPLAFVVNHSDHTHKKLWASAHAIDDLAEGRCREAWRSKLVPEARRYSKWERRYVQHDDGSDPAMVGTCNGLVCLSATTPSPAAPSPW